MPVITINPPKALANLGVTAPFEFDTDKVNDGAYVYMIRQGLRYALSARASHTFAALLDPKREGGPQQPTQEDAQEVFDGLVADCYAAQWPERERSERQVLSLEDAVWQDLLKEKFTTAGALRKGRAERAANGDKPAQPAVPAITVDSLVAQHGSREAAYRAVFAEAVAALYRQRGVELDDALRASIAQRADKGWADLVAAHAKELRARQRAAAKQADPESFNL